MLEHYGRAVMEARQHDRRLAAVEDYFRREYGTTSGMERHLTEARHTSSPRSSFRTFLAKIARAVARPRTQAATPMASVDRALSDDSAEHVTQVAPVTSVTPAAAARPVGRRFKVRPRAVLPPVRR